MHKLWQIFNGTWEFERKIIDKQNQAVEVINGHAYFNKIEENVIAYKENGIRNFGKNNLKFQRFYIYKLIDKIIHCYFSDESFEQGPLFMALNNYQGSHLCLNDFYESTYNIISDKKFNISYKVKGNNKNYISSTNYIIKNS